MHQCLKLERYSPDIRRIALPCRLSRDWTAVPSSASGKHEGLMKVKEPAVIADLSKMGSNT